MPQISPSAQIPSPSISFSVSPQAPAQSSLPGMDSYRHAPHPQPSSTAELTRVFNSAVLSTRSDRKRDFAGELYELVGNPAFTAILDSIRNFARAENISERQAAEKVIQTFRAIDSVWSDYVFQEGLDRLRGE